MNRVKKSAFAICAALVFCWLSVVSVAAIDTPWLTVAPDGGSETESVAPEAPTDTTPSSESKTEEQQSAPTPEASGEKTNGTNETQLPESSGVASSEQSVPQKDPAPVQGSQAPTSSEPTSGGCGATMNGYGWIFALICVAWMLCKIKRAEEKEVNG